MTGQKMIEIEPQMLADLTAIFGAERLAAMRERLRDPDAIMTPDALSAMKACSLSFSRTLLDKMVEERWQIRCRNIEVDREGNGFAVYDLTVGRHSFSLIVRACWDGEEKPGRRMDRTADFIASLTRHRADDALIARELAAMAIPHWGGRTDAASYGWTAANRSQRFFEHAVERLEHGEQPDLDELAQGGGYVIRNAGFYGNGRAGAASWAGIEDDHPFAVPYHMDLFLVYMWREIGLDFVDAIAAARSPRAARLSPSSRRYIGVGNSSGLGMTCALVRWPQWVNVWCLTRELALAYAKTAPSSSVHAKLPQLQDRLARAIRYYREVAGPTHGLTSHEVLADDLERLLSQLHVWSEGPEGLSWAILCEHAENSLGGDGLEQLHAFLIDLYPEATGPMRRLVSPAMRQTRRLDPHMTVGALRRLMAKTYGWVLRVDRSTPERCWHFWYHSEEAGEQRRGERHIDPGVEFETFVDVVGAVQLLAQHLEKREDDELVARYLLAHPDDAYIVSRIQFMAGKPYGEIRGNLVDRDFLPIKVIRFFLSIFGFESGAPRSIAWVRGVLLQGAPSPAEIAQGEMRDWLMPVKPVSEPAE
ncbi:hypothetical protein [Rhodoligotrophos ferricapiens]|uniref:hypothetical protein n=1 Tax=Rhodoligotrophos ferricapiens TaxID=3069264 RepID=UPI00315DA96C